MDDRYFIDPKGKFVLDEMMIIKFNIALILGRLVLTDVFAFVASEAETKAG